MLRVLEGKWSAATGRGWGMADKEAPSCGSGLVAELVTRARTIDRRPSGMTCVRRPAGARMPASSTSAPCGPEPRPGRWRARLSLLLTLGLLLGALCPFRRSSPPALPDFFYPRQARSRSLLRTEARPIRAVQPAATLLHRRSERHVHSTACLARGVAARSNVPDCTYPGGCGLWDHRHAANGERIARRGSGGPGSRTSSFTLSGQFPEPVWQPVRVEYATSSGTAASGTDFLATSGTLVFWHGGERTHEHSQVVRVLDDPRHRAGGRRDVHVDIVELDTSEARERDSNGPDHQQQRPGGGSSDP